MSSSSILATKILLVSSGVVFLAMTLKFTIIPWLINFTVSELPIIWSVLASLCKPPYLYVVINAIIITIAASSRFTRTETEKESIEHYQPLISAKTPPLIELQHDMFVAAAYVVEEVVIVHDNKVLNVNNNQVVEKVELVEDEVVETKDEEEVRERVEVVEAAFSKSSRQKSNTRPQEPEVVLPVRGKPRPLSRFGPPKPSKPSPQGKRDVIIEKESMNSEEVTLESMWKAIMEGREEPSEQLMKKSNIVEDYTQKVDDNSRWKTTTFKGRASYISETPVKSWILKKEPTLSQDELNRRADEFIQKFNEEMRMQRQQSMNQNRE